MDDKEEEASLDWLLNSDTNINTDDFKISSFNLTSPVSLDGFMNLQPTTTLQTFQTQESSNFGPTRFEISSNKINSLTIDPRKIEINSNEDRFDPSFYDSSNHFSIPRSKTYPLPKDSPNTFKKRMVNSSKLQTIDQKEEVSNFPQMRISNNSDDNPCKKVELYSLHENEQVQFKDVKIRLREDSIDDHYNKQDLCRAGNNVLKELAKRHKVSKLSQRKNPWGNFSYRDMIRICLESQDEKRMQLNEIYDWISDTVPFFRGKNTPQESQGWKNSIRHNLSLHPEFVKIPCSDNPKQTTWALEETLTEAEKQTIVPSKRAENRKEEFGYHPVASIENPQYVFEQQPHHVYPVQETIDSHNTLRPGYSSERASNRATRAVEKLGLGYGKTPSSNCFSYKQHSHPYSRPNSGSLSAGQKFYSEKQSSGYSSFDKIDGHDLYHEHEQRPRVSSMPNNVSSIDKNKIRPRFSTAFLQSKRVEGEFNQEEKSSLEIQIEEAIKNMDR